MLGKVTHQIQFDHTWHVAHGDMTDRYAMLFCLQSSVGLCTGAFGFGFGSVFGFGFAAAGVPPELSSGVVDDDMVDLDSVCEESQKWGKF